MLQHPPTDIHVHHRCNNTHPLAYLFTISVTTFIHWHTCSLSVWQHSPKGTPVHHQCYNIHPLAYLFTINVTTVIHWHFHHRYYNIHPLTYQLIINATTPTHRHTCSPSLLQHPPTNIPAHHQCYNIHPHTYLFTLDITTFINQHTCSPPQHSARAAWFRWWCAEIVRRIAMHSTHAGSDASLPGHALCRKQAA